MIRYRAAKVANRIVQDGTGVNPGMAFASMSSETYPTEPNALKTADGLFVVLQYKDPDAGWQDVSLDFDPPEHSHVIPT